MKEANELELETRRDIFDIIARNPGVHLSKIAEILDKKITVVELHLHDMEHHKLISSVEQDGYKRYFIYKEEKPVTIRDQRVMETRDQIYQLIEQNPGIYMSKIAQKLDVGISLVQYHVNQMEKNKTIIGMRESGYFKRYYLPGSQINIQERKILALLRQETPLRIVLFLLKHPNAKHKDILKEVSISSSTLSYHLNKLASQDIIEIPLYTENRGYNIKNKENITSILRKYKLFTLSNTFRSMWEDLNYQN